MKRNILAVVLSCLAATVFLFDSAEAKKVKKKVDGKQVFQQNCASCHAGGGNRVKPGMPLAESKVLASAVSFKTYLSAPPGHMPYIERVVKNQELLTALYNYCKTIKRQPIKQAML